MTTTIAYHPGWQQQRSARQPVTIAPPNATSILALLLAVAMVAMVAVLSAGGSLAVASMVALPVVMVALSVASGSFLMEVMLWTENYSRLYL